MIFKIKNILPKLRKPLSANAAAQVSEEDRAIAAHFVDPDFYYYRYQDVAMARMDPITHFVTFGWKEGRDPNPYTLLDYVKNAYNDQTDSFSSLAKLLCGEIYHNPLLRRPITLATLREAEDAGDAALDELFLFDVTAYAAAQFDVLASWNRHPVNHLFFDGLFQNRLRDGRFLDRQLVPVDNFETDYELLVRQEQPFRAVIFQGLDLSVKEKPDLSGIRLDVGVVLYKNSRAGIERLVRSVQSNAKGQPFSVHLWVWDNSPDFHELDRVPETCPDVPVDVSFHPENVGFALGHNGIMEMAFAAGASYYLGLNPDGHLFPNSLVNLLSFAVAKGSPSLIEMECEPLSHPKWYHPVTGETDWVTGAAFLLDRETFARTGGFDPDFPMYCEDTDLSFRARMAGVRLYVAPRARFYHDVSERLHGQEQWRTQRMLLGTLYLCEKWQNPQRAAEIRAELACLGANVSALPNSSQKVENVTPEIQRLMRLDRFAVSRFWAG